MEYTLEQKFDLIEQDIVKCKGTNPIAIAKEIMKKPYINIHGPEHHLLDGSAFLVAYKNAGGDIDLKDAISKLRERAIKMPGAICGQWGICGSTTSIGAAMSIIHGTGPLSNDENYKEHMEYTSSVIAKMSKIGGPRCCKRNAFLSISTAVEFVNEKYGVHMTMDKIDCEFSSKNSQCIGARCPFNKAYKGDIV